MRYRAVIVAVALLLSVPSPLRAQQVPQKDIDEAIRKGADYLVKQYSTGLTETNMAFELIIYTLIHADVDPSKVTFLKDGIGKLMTLEPASLGPKTTYRVAIQALARFSGMV